MEDFFDYDGHLTDFALREVISGEPDELSRLEISEHLSFCDECIDRYANMLDDSILISAREDLSYSIIKKVRNRIRAIFVNKYATVAVAACFTMVLWTNGVFDINYNDISLNRYDKSFYSKINNFSDNISEVIDDIAKNIYNFKEVIKHDR